MDNMISFAAYESQGTRLERSNKRLFILNVVLVIVLFVSNALWVIYESQFRDEIQIEQEVDTGDGDAYVTGIGDLNHGESKAKNN